MFKGYDFSPERHGAKIIPFKYNILCAKTL